MTQNDRVLRELKRRWDGLTSLDAITDLGVTRLAARIADLEAEGVRIRHEMVTVPNRYGEKVRVARYRLVAQ